MNSLPHPPAGGNVSDPGLDFERELAVLRRQLRAHHARIGFLDALRRLTEEQLDRELERLQALSRLVDQRRAAAGEGMSS